MASPAKIERLRQALDRYEQQGSDLFDRQAEEAKSPVRHRALLLLDQRGRSRHELRERLLALEFDSQVIESVLDDLARNQLIDDAFFAQEWVRQRHTMRGKSRRALEQELKIKGIATGEREAALAQIDEADEKAMASAIAAKKARSIKQVPANRAEYDKQLRRVVGVLARRGFGTSISVQLARESLDQRIADLE